MAEPGLDPERENENQEETPHNPNVTNKYKAAADVVNEAMKKLIAECQPGRPIIELCELGDSLLEAGLAKSYSKQKKIEKGIAFPTCISPNFMCGHYSPLEGESIPLGEGDIIKIDMGAHIDGYISATATTLVVGAEPATGRRADVVLGAHAAIEAGLRLLKPGNTNTQITEIIAKAASQFNVVPIEGVLSHQTKRHVIDGNQCIINKDTTDQHVKEFTFEPNQVYHLDIFLSTGEGKTRESPEIRTTVFKRVLENTYNLKLKASRAFFAELNQRFPISPFTIRAFSSQQNARLGVNECLKHDLLFSYPVLVERPDEFVAQFKYTIVILPTRVLCLSRVPFDSSRFTSEFSIADEELNTLLATSMEPERKKKAEEEKKE